MARRRDRFNLRGKLWEMSTLKSVRGCGRNLRFGLTAEDGVGVKRGEDSAGYSRLSTCGSPWACPRCSAVIAVQRAEQISRAIDRNVADGGTVGFLTLTMRHNKGHRLAELWDHLQAGWTGLFGTPAFKGSKGRIRKDGTRAADRIGEKQRYGVLGTLRTVEVTHNDVSGWHVHIHALVFFEGDPFEDQEAMNAWADVLFKRYSNALVKAGMPAPSREHGLDFRKIGADGSAAFLADYLTKSTADATAPKETLKESMAVGLEAAAGPITKQTRSEGSRVPFQILRDAIEEDRHRPLKDRYHWYMPKGWGVEEFDGEQFWVCQNPDDPDFGVMRKVDPTTGTVMSIPSRDFAIWHTYEQASKGRRQLLWTRRYKDPETDLQRRWNAILDARGDDGESSDEELADREVFGVDVAGIDYGDWFNRMTRRPSLLYDLLETIENGRVQDAEQIALDWGERHGIKMWGEGVDPASPDLVEPPG